MLLTEKLNQISNSDRVLTITDATWEDYEELDSPEYDCYLISYLKNEITIMSPGRNHERIAELIGILIETYCRKVNLPYYPFGSTRLKKEKKEGKEADTGYAFVTEKEYPDLSVEVNFTSGSIKDLTKYQYLKIKEVWLYQNQEIKFYYLQDNCYSEIEESICLPGIKPEELIEYINRGFTESPLSIDRDWSAKLASQTEPPTTPN